MWSESRVEGTSPDEEKDGEEEQKLWHDLDDNGGN